MRKIEAEASILVIWRLADAGDRAMERLAAKKLGEHKAIFDINELSDASLVCEPLKALPYVVRSRGNYAA